MIDPRNGYPSPVITPEKFENIAKEYLDALGGQLTQYTSRARIIESATDGDYEIDISCSFEALGVEFRVIAECKRYKERVKRQVVSELHSKMQSLGYHKGIVFSVAGFQSGAIRFADQHGIALIQICDGRSKILLRSFAAQNLLHWDQVPNDTPDLVCWVVKESSVSLLELENPIGMRASLGISVSN